MSQREFHRADRVSGEIHRTLSELVRDEIDDPRLKLATITGVRVSRDLSHARVYFSLLDDNVDRAEATDVLQSAAGFLRGRLGRMLTMRQVPALNFEFDDSTQRGARMNALIAGAIESDRRKTDEDD